MVLNRSAIKKEARDFIGVNTLWLQMFVAFFIVQLPVSICSGFSSGIGGFIGALSDAESFYPADMIFYVISLMASFISLAVSIFIIPFTIGLAGYFLQSLRLYKPEITAPYTIGKKHYSKFLGTGLLTGALVFLWSLLFVIPGIVKALAYSMTSYIINDNPELSSSEAIDLSKRITKGYKADLFILGLSYFFWYIGVAFTGGLLMVYLAPYMQTVKTMYYENLKYNAIMTGIVTPRRTILSPTDTTHSTIKTVSIIRTISIIRTVSIIRTPLLRSLRMQSITRLRIPTKLPTALTIRLRLTLSIWAADLQAMFLRKKLKLLRLKLTVQRNKNEIRSYSL